MTTSTWETMLWPPIPTAESTPHPLRATQSTSQLHRKGRPSDDRAPALGVSESLTGPPRWLPAPARQENPSGLYSGVSAAVGFGWETDLVHSQRWRTVCQRPSFQAALWYGWGLLAHPREKRSTSCQEGRWQWGSSTALVNCLNRLLLSAR